MKRHTGGSGWISGGASLGAATQGWRFLGCSPEQPALSSHWPLLCEAHTTPVTLLGCDLATTWLQFSKWNNLELQGWHVNAKPCCRLLPEDTSEMDYTCDLFISTTILSLITLSHPFATPNKHTKLIIISNSSGKIFWDSFVGYFSFRLPIFR